MWCHNTKEQNMNCHCEGLKPQVKNNLFDYHSHCCSEAREDGTNVTGAEYVIQGVSGGMCQTSGECSLGQTIPI